MLKAHVSLGQKKLFWVQIKSQLVDKSSARQDATWLGSKAYLELPSPWVMANSGLVKSFSKWMVTVWLMGSAIIIMEQKAVIFISKGVNLDGKWIHLFIDRKRQCTGLRRWRTSVRWAVAVSTMTPTKNCTRAEISHQEEWTCMLRVREKAQLDPRGHPRDTRC